MKKLFIAVGIVALVVILALIPLPFESTSKIVSSVFIARRREIVFDYVTTPANWPIWHPSSLSVHGATDHPLIPNEQVTENYKVAGHTGVAVWTVTERSFPERWTIAAIVDGRNAGQVRYVLSSEGEGTRFTREFLYHPRSLFTMAFDRISLRAQINAESTQAVEQLKAQLESAGPRL
jgi:hypothetical protein